MICKVRPGRSLTSEVASRATRYERREAAARGVRPAVSPRAARRYRPTFDRPLEFEAAGNEPASRRATLSLNKFPKARRAAELFDIWPFTISGLSNKTLGARSVFRNAISSSCWTSERPVKRFADDDA